MASLRTRLGLHPDTIYIVDGSAFVYRAFYAFQNMARSDGFPTNILFIVTRLLLRLIREEQPAYFSFVLDGKGPSPRKELFADYKANRSATPEPLIQQLEPLHRILGSLGLPFYVSYGCEADDCIASLVERFSATHPLVIVGADKDLKQCLRENVVLWDPASKEEKITTLQAFREEMGMEPSSWPDYQALVGDSSDNIPGIAKVGPKTAQALIEEFPTLEDLFSRLPAVVPKIRPKLEGQAENAFLYRKLTTLQRDVCPEITLESLRVEKATLAPVTQLLQEFELRSLVREVESMDRAGVWQREAPRQAEPQELPRMSAQAKKAPAGVNTAHLGSTDRGALGKLATQASPAKTLGVENVTMVEGSLFMAVAVPDAASFPSTGQESDLLLGDTVFLLPMKEGLLVASQGRETLFTGTDAALVTRLAESKGRLIAPDTKTLCKARPALWALWNAAPDRWFDLSLAAYLLNPEDRSYAWEHVALRFGELCGSLYPLQASPQHPGLLGLDIAHFLVERLQGADLNGVFAGIEMPLVPVLARMEERGIALDKRAAADFLHGVQADLDALTRRIHELGEGPFNIRSSQQLGHILFNQLALPKAGKTKGGAMSTSQEALEKLTGKHPIIEALLEYRKLEKLRSTYLDPLPGEADIHSRIHTTFNQTATATGRLSSSNPNLQNIPIRGPLGGRMRSLFVAGPGFSLVCADYSQIELRVLAHLSQDPTLLEAFHNNEDIHSRTAALLFDTSTDRVTPDERRNAKTINFGLIYGMGAQKLGQDLGISMKEAKVFIERYFSRLARLKEFYESIEEEARQNGYVSTMTGRRRLAPDILSSNNQLRSQARRQAINTRIQGSAADIIKLAMLRVEEDEELTNLGAKLILQVHDELLLEVRPEAAEAAGKRLAYLMESVAPGGIPLSVPLLVEWGQGTDWSLAH